MDEMTQVIYEDLQGMGSSLPDSFCKMVLKRLERIGYDAWCTGEEWTLAFFIRKAEVEILDYCHIDLIPSTLYPMLCDRACGKFLYNQKQTGKLDIEGLDLSGILTSLTEGDVKMDFDSGASDSDRLDALLGLMMDSGKGQLQCYRRIRF